MAVAMRIRVTEDTATPVLNGLSDALNGPRRAELHDVMGRAVNNNVRSHLAGLEKSRPNQLGGRRTHFWAAAARSTHYRVVQDGAVISINHLGFRQRLEGGVIRPTGGRRLLTIPACPEAYGRRAGEFKDLVFIPASSGAAGLLIRAPQSTLRKTKKGYSGKLTGGQVMFRLVPMVRQKPDPTVIPTAAEISAVARNAAEQYLDRITQRRT